jgi:hypothetical protein
LDRAGIAGLLARIKAAVLSLLSWTSEGTISDAQKIKDDYWKFHSELVELERKHGDLQKQLGHDFGPNGEFLPLYGRWCCGLINPYTLLVSLPDRHVQLAWA